MKFIKGFILCVIIIISIIPGFLLLLGFVGFYPLNLPLALCFLIFCIFYFISLILCIRKNSTVETDSYSSNQDEEDYDYNYDYDYEEEIAPDFEWVRTKDGELLYLEKSLTNDNFYTTLDGKHTFIRYKNGILSEIK